MLFLTFTAAGATRALKTASIIKLVPRVGLRAIPHAQAHLAGLLDYRGEVVPVIDLALFLGSSPCADRLSARIILVKSGRRGSGTSATEWATSPTSALPVRSNWRAWRTDSGRTSFGVTAVRPALSRACFAATPYGASSGLAMAMRLTSGLVRSGRPLTATPDFRLTTRTRSPWA
jgi:hypothetical protein